MNKTLETPRGISTWQASICGKLVTPKRVGECLRTLGLPWEHERVDQQDRVRFSQTLSLRPDGQALVLTVAVVNQVADRTLVSLPWPGLTKEEAVPGWLAPFAVRTQIELGEHPAELLRLQLKLLQALCPEAPFVLDVDTAAVRSASWLRHATADGEPLDLLETVLVQDVAGPSGHWIHSHGAPRVGGIDLDLVGVPEFEVSEMRALLLAALRVCLRRGRPEPGELFEAESDLSLRWLPWREGLACLQAEDATGGLADREDGLHQGERGILVTAEHGNPADQFAQSRGRDSEVAWLSEEQADRMRAHARETWPRFTALFDWYGQHPQLTFLVKVRLAEDVGDLSYVWLRMDDFGDDWIDATRIFEPAVPELPMGESREYDLGQLTDWAIGYGNTLYESEAVDELERRLIEDGVPRDD